MKTVNLLLWVILLMGISGFQPGDKKARKAQQEMEMGKLIERGSFKFVVQSARSNLGTFNNLGTTYDMVFDSLKLKAYLPYYGRAYSVPYGGSGGVKFDLTAEKIEKTWNEKKKLFTIMTKVNNTEDSYDIQLTAGLSGYADLKITFRNRQWISYYGRIEKIER
jgi:hypothetical protein